MSSVRIIRAACLVTSLPLPIATPMSACLSAAASLTASPVIATISPWCCMTRARRSLSSGETRPNTCSSGSRRSSSSSDIACSSAPLIAPGPSPRFSPIACAVTAWSPVIIRTSIPACSAVVTAALASARSGSMMPTMPTKPRSCVRRHRVVRHRLGLVVTDQPGRESQDPQALLTHPGVRRLDAGAGLVDRHLGAAQRATGLGAAGQHHVRAALDQLDDAIGRVDRERGGRWP